MDGEAKGGEQGFLESFLWPGLQKKARLIEAMTTGQRVAIDIHYQDQMNTKVAIVWTPYDQEQFSVVRQLGLCHKANKEAKEPVSIHVCGAVCRRIEMRRRLLKQLRP